MTVVTNMTPVTYFALGTALSHMAPRPRISSKRQRFSRHAPGNRLRHDMIIYNPRKFYGRNVNYSVFYFHAVIQEQRVSYILSTTFDEMLEAPHHLTCVIILGMKSYEEHSGACGAGRGKI